jgi:hypothetical protein
MSDFPRQGGFDAGWLFVVAGVAICAAGLLIPAQRDLMDIRQKRDALHHEEVVANERLAAHSTFLADVEREDPLLVRRLAAAQLNLMPKGDTPVLLASSGQAPVTTWIDATVSVPPIPNGARADSPLARLATGPHRLWLLSGGVLAVFLGLLLDPSIGKVRVQSRSTAAAPPSFAQPSLQLDLVDAVNAGDPIVSTIEPLETPLVLPTAEVDTVAHGTEFVLAHSVNVQLDVGEASDSNDAVSVVEFDLPAGATIDQVHETIDSGTDALPDETATNPGPEVQLTECESELNAVDHAHDDGVDCVVDLNESDQESATSLDLPVSEPEVACKPQELPAPAAADDPVSTGADDPGLAPPDIETFDPFGQSHDTVPADNEQMHQGVPEPAADDGGIDDCAEPASSSEIESTFPVELPFRPL